MGRYKLFNDYINSINLTPFEVLRKLKYLVINDDDDRLLVPALFYLGKARAPTSIATVGDVVRMIEKTNWLRKLHGHKYNVYECCFLSIDDEPRNAGLITCLTVFSLIAQVLLLIILICYNWSDITNVKKRKGDWGTIIVVVITTVVFTKLVLVQGENACDFNAVFGKSRGFLKKEELKTWINKLKNELLWINIIVNLGLGAIIVIFNIFFLLISKDVNEAILNSLALLFILEIDDVLNPDWDEMYIDSRIVLNISYDSGGDGWDDGGDVPVEIISYTATATPGDYLRLRLLEIIQAASPQDYLRLLTSAQAAIGEYSLLLQILRAASITAEDLYRRNRSAKAKAKAKAQAAGAECLRLESAQAEIRADYWQLKIRADYLQLKSVQAATPEVCLRLRLLECIQAFSPEDYYLRLVLESAQAEIRADYSSLREIFQKASPGLEFAPQAFIRTEYSSLRKCVQDAIEEDYSHLIESDAKVTFQVTDPEDLYQVVTISWKLTYNDENEKIVKFLIRDVKGKGPYFFHNIREFRCVKKDAEKQALNQLVLGHPQTDEDEGICFGA